MSGDKWNQGENTITVEEVDKIQRWEDLWLHFKPVMFQSMFATILFLWFWSKIYLLYCTLFLVLVRLQGWLNVSQHHLAERAESRNPSINEEAGL